MKHAISVIALVAAMPAFSQTSRALGAHEHGFGTLNIAIEGATVAMAFEAPGADIVGFEYGAKSDADLAAIDAAITTLSAPLDLFVLPEAAACTVTQARAELEGDAEGHEHDDHEAHGDHDDEAHEDHGHDHGHDDHKHEDHKHEDHHDHEEAAGHTEFHAEYTLTCDTPDAVTRITFAYFDTFPNAKEIEVQIVTKSGAQAFGVDRANPVLDLGR